MKFQSLMSALSALQNWRRHFDIIPWPALTWLD